MKKVPSRRSKLFRNGLRSPKAQISSCVGSTDSRQSGLSPDRIAAASLDESQHLAKQRCRVLGIAARFDVARSLVVGVSAVAARDIEIALVADSRAEADPAVIVLRLVEGR